jgi:hypothetical protein
MTGCQSARNGYKVKPSRFLVVTAVAFSVVLSSTNGQYAFDDSGLRRNTAARIMQHHGINLDWQKASLSQLIDAEARLDAVKRIKGSYGVDFDWQKTTLVTLVDAEARIASSARIARLTNEPVDWRAHSLIELTQVEAKLRGVNVNAAAKEPTSRPAPRSGTAPPSATVGSSVYLIAPSVSTSMEARSIMQTKRWTESNLRQANAILVVVRSMLFNPLSYSYGSVKELQDDAENQLNISGENFHVYVYSLDDNLAVNQQSHISYKAGD